MTTLPISIGDLQAAIDSLPRIKLASLPTPLQECPRFSRALGGPRVFVKRDDLTGLAFGGNKTRKLEFSMPEHVKNNVEVIVAGAAVQSNFCRQTAAAAAKLGMRSILLLLGRPDAEVQGNLLLDDILGAEVHLEDRNSYLEMHAMLESVAKGLRAKGQRAAAMNGFEPVASVGYVLCMVEMARQFEELGIRPSRMYVASGTGTLAGLEVGCRALGLDVVVTGVSPSHEVLEGYPTTEHRFAEVGTWVANHLALDLGFSPSDFNYTLAYGGPGYGLMNPSALEAIRLLARTEGILLDPVYTCKALSALIDHVRTGEIGKDETVVFVHTGGTPALFARTGELVSQDFPMGGWPVDAHGKFIG